MKVLRIQILFFMIAGFSFAYATNKPSTWQKFKDMFSVKKPTAQQSAQESLKGPSFFQSIKKLYGRVENFYEFSREHMMVLSLKVDGLKAMREEGKKAKQREQLEMPLKRLRADFFMSLIEYLREAKSVVQGLRTFLQERQNSNAQIFDSILQNFDKVIKEGDHIVDQLLQSSKAYALKDAMKKTETKISDCFNKITKLLSSMKKPIDITQNIINKSVSVLKGVNIFTVGSATMFVVFAKKLNNALKTFQMATDLGRDITSMLDNEAASRVSALQNQSTMLMKDAEASKKDVQKIENVLEKNKGEIERISRPIDNSTAELQAGKSLEGMEDESDELFFEDLMPKKRN